MGTVINLAAVRAARQAADDPTCDDLADLAPHQLTAHMRGHARRAPPPASPLTAAPKPARASASPPPLHWQESQRGNLWTLDARSGSVIVWSGPPSPWVGSYCDGSQVIFENRRGWAGRVTLPWGKAWFEDMPGVPSAAAAD
jgi:hypothetical protein